MAYAKKSFRRRRVYKRIPWYRKKYNAMQLASKAWRGVRKIRGLVNSEMLHLDKTYSSATISGTGSVSNLTAIGQDDTVSGRTGNSILLRNCTWRLKFEINSSVTVDTSLMMAIVLDTQQVGDTTPAFTDVFAAANPESLLAVGTFGRFKVLYRKTYILTPASGGKPAIEVAKTLNMYHHVRFNGTTSSDIQKNGLYILLVGSESTNLPTVSGTVRIGYHDN